MKIHVKNTQSIVDHFMEMANKAETLALAIKKTSKFKANELSHEAETWRAAASFMTMVVFDEN